MNFIDSVDIRSPLISFKGKNFEAASINRERSDSSVNLVLCLDGTENEFGLKPYTNVLKLFRMLDKDTATQLCYYQPGVGAKFKAESTDIREPNFFQSKLSKIGNKFDAMFAFTLERHVLAAYTFLMKFYQKGDKIYIIGFSRGSFTGRVLAGMIERVGLLNNGLEEMTATAWELYSNWEYAGQPAQQGSEISLSDQFKETFSRKDVDIHFMGLWDSVNSVGILRDRLFPFTIRSSIVEHVRHAVSIDERRGKYKQVLFQPYSYFPNLFNLDCEDCEDCEDMESDQMETSLDTNSNSPLLTHNRINQNKKSSFSSIGKFLSNIVNSVKKSRLPSIPSEDVVELFFSGSHSDCGGGWPKDLNGQYLSDIPLRWILLEAIKFGIKFKEGSIHEFNEKHPVTASLFSCHHDLLSTKREQPMMHYRVSILERIKKTLRIGSENRKLNFQQLVQQIEIGPRIDKSPKLPVVQPLTHSEATTPVPLPKFTIRLFDSRCDEYLWTSLFWWLIELLPIGYKIENTDGKWRRVYIPNFGRHRKLPKNVSLHWSVFYRLKFVEDYNPRNLPKDLGSKFRDLIKDFKDLFKEDDIEGLIEDLTIEKIKTDKHINKNNIWTKTPDELKPLLDKFPDL